MEETVTIPAARLAYLEERTAELRDANEKLENELAERKRAEKQIRLLKNFLANIIDSMPSVLVGLDRNEIVTQWNLQA